MTFKSSVFLFCTLLFFTGLACQLSAVQTPATIDKEAIVQEVIATLQAQSSQPAAIPTFTGATLPVNGPDLQNALITVYQRANPSVVQIFVYDTAQDTEFPLGSGTGFVYDTTGHIITNNHVVADGSNFEVVFADGSRRSASVVGTDVDSDLAIIKVEEPPTNIQPIPLGDSTNLQVGQFVIAIGNPFGEVGSMSIGIVSGLGRTLESQRIAPGGGFYSLPQVIQTDAAINPGNSGGPLLNLNGEVVGVNSAILTTTGTNSGVGYSIPVAAVKRIAPHLISTGSYTYPYIGIRMTDLTLGLQETLGLSRSAGAYITDITSNSPAEEAGLVSSGETSLGDPLTGGDLIVAIDGQPVQNTNDLISYLVFHTEVGQTIQLTVVREDSEISVPLTLGARP